MGFLVRIVHFDVIAIVKSATKLQESARMNDACQVGKGRLVVKVK
jgi:hypothetical protein